MSRYLRFAIQLGATAIVVFASGLIGSKVLTQSTSIEVGESELILNDFPLGENKSISVNVRNPGFFGKVQVVGFGGSCGLGCVEEVDFKPFQLEPGETKKLSMLVKSPRQPGPIEAAFTLFYTSNNGTRRKELCVRGNAVE